MHNKQDEVECLPSGVRVGSLKDKNLSSSPRGKCGQDKLLLDSLVDFNQF